MQQRMRPSIGPAFNHLDECIGCGAHIADACAASCAFRTRVVDVPFLLRATARTLNDYQAFSGGFWIADAISAAALQTVDTPGFEEARTATFLAFRAHLIDLLQWTDTREIVERWGQRSEHTTIVEELGAAAYRFTA